MVRSVSYYCVVLHSIQWGVQRMWSQAGSHGRSYLGRGKATKLRIPEIEEELHACSELSTRVGSRSKTLANLPSLGGDFHLFLLLVHWCECVFRLKQVIKK